MHVEYYLPGEKIYKKGDKARYFYVIKSGEVCFELYETKEEL